MCPVFHTNPASHARVTVNFLGAFPEVGGGTMGVRLKAVWIIGRECPCCRHGAVMPASNKLEPV